VNAGHEGSQDPPEQAGTDAPSYGFPSALWRAIGRRRPPGFPSERAWRSPLRGPWLTSVFGAVLLVGLPVVVVTGLLSYLAYGVAPRPSEVGVFRLPRVDWPTDPSWLYRLTQGLHVGLGLMLIPVVLAKLWSVIPRLFAWPPVRSAAQLLERISLGLLVGSILFELATGVLNIQYDYVFGFSFYTGHYWGAWVFTFAFLTHVSLKLPLMVRSLRSRSLRRELRTPLSLTTVETGTTSDLVATDPGPPTVSRRGALAIVGGGALLVGLVSAGETIGGVMRRVSVLSVRSRVPGEGPNDFQVNRTARSAAITAADVDEGWRLVLTGPDGATTLDRSQLLAMSLHTAVLPIACVEGWSSTQTWTGVRLRDLAALTGVPEPTAALVRSLERRGSFNRAPLQGNQVLAPDSLLALRVNGVDLSRDHGYPARIIVPALPGVHNTKWVKSIDFRGPR
jgi:DMSO/TMAO reductase YedYZ molybdopterin-dependent catalytic subunit